MNPKLRRAAFLALTVATPGGVVFLIGTFRPQSDVYVPDLVVELISKVVLGDRGGTETRQCWGFVTNFVARNWSLLFLLRGTSYETATIYLATATLELTDADFGNSFASKNGGSHLTRSLSRIYSAGLHAIPGMAKLGSF